MTDQMSNNGENKTNERKLSVGQKFNDYEQVSTYIKAFCQEQYHPFVIRSRSQKQIVYICCHGVKRNSKCQGKRPNQHYYYKSCKAQINFYRSKSGIWTLTKVILDHNHTLGREEYRSYAKKARRKIENDNDTTMDLSLTREHGMIASVLNKTIPTETEQQKLIIFLSEIKKAGGVYSIKIDAGEEVESLFVASSEMVTNYKNSQCPVIQIDVSFGFNVANYKLLVFCYYSSITNQSEFAAIALIAKETYAAFVYCINEFKKICATNPCVFLIDKDFTEINAIRNVFSGATILLGKIQVIKHFKQLVSAAFNCQIDEQNKLLDKFKKCLNSQSYEEYEAQKNEFLSISSFVQVYIEKEDKYDSLDIQFLNYWDNRKEMWVYFFRKHLPLMGETTAANRVEQSFWTLKRYMQTKYNHSLPTIYLCIKEIINGIDQINKCYTNKQKVFKILDSDTEIRKILEGCFELLTEPGIKLFHRQLKSFKAFEAKMSITNDGIEENLDGNITKCYNTTVETCSCSFWKSYSAPCYHILMLRKYNDLNIFSKTCFHARYIILFENALDKDTDDVNDDDEVKDDFYCSNKILTASDRFDSVLAITKNIAHILSNYGTQTFNKYVEELKVIERNATNGVSLFQHDSRWISESGEPEVQIRSCNEPTFHNNLD